MLLKMAEEKPSFFILFLLVAFGSVGAVLFTPALPAIQNFFQVSVGQAQMTMTTYLLGYALGQLPYGPLANGIGRKKTLSIGIYLSILGSLLCAFSSFFHSFEMLIFARFLQALGATVGLKISYTMVADCYEQQEATRIISRFVLAFAIIPGIGIAIGGLLTAWFGWQSCFYFLALFGLFVLVLARQLPETAPEIDRKHLKIAAIIEGYRLKFQNRSLILCAFMMGCGGAVIYIFAAKAPFIGISLIALTPETFGVYNLIPALGMIIGSFVSAALVGRIPIIKTILLALSTALISTFFMLIPFAISGPTTFFLFMPMMFVYIAQSVAFANVASYGLSTAKDKSNASAVFNFINISTIVFAVLFSEMLYPESALALPLFFIFFLFLALLAGLKLKHTTHP